MKAMILAAGLGTRLRPLTDTRPKALVEAAGRTLLEITIARLRTFGVTEVIVNVHHFADMVVDYLKSKNNFGIRVEISREEILLDTGGGLKQAALFFQERSAPANEPFILHNVDIISTIDLRSMLQAHQTSHALATLAVQTRESSRQLLFDKNLQLSGRINGRNAAPELVRQAVASAPEMSTLTPLAFSGIHIISPRLLPMLTETGVFSIIPAYLRLAAQNQSIHAFRADRYHWRDLGRPQDLAQAAQDFEKKVLS
ncbi:MAG TPA: nucleotidyltransferase family protein [Candidatus Acidoferrum sp.]|jgi:NDP-sugar pyrophosphorylase family protein